MSFQNFMEEYDEPIWFRAENEPRQFIILKPDEESFMGIYRSLYIQPRHFGTTRARRVIVTDETYEWLKRYDMVPRTGIGEYEKPRLRALLNVLDLVDNIVKVWDLPGTLVARLNSLDMDPEAGGIFGWVLEITKESIGLNIWDVKYDLRVVGPAELTSQQRMACQNLHDLERLVAPHTWEYICKTLGIQEDDLGPVTD